MTQQYGIIQGTDDEGQVWYIEVDEDDSGIYVEWVEDKNRASKVTQNFFKTRREEIEDLLYDVQWTWCPTE